MLGGFPSAFSGWCFNDIYASTKTDSQGKFSFLYSAEGSSYDYALEALTSESIESHDTYSLRWNYNQTDIRICVRELNYTKLFLKVESNPYDTLYLYTYLTERMVKLTGRSIDTFLYLRNMPNCENSVFYKISTMTRDSGYISRELEVKYLTDLKDTVTITKNIFSTYSIPFWH